MALGCALLTLLFMVAAASASAFTARGSVEQVYVTGLSSGQRMSLVNRRGRVVKTQAASSLGGLLFREVKPGTGYRVRPAGGGASSGPLTVLSRQPAPPSTGVYNQQIQPSGYQYLTTRDGTKLAIDVHPATDITNASPVKVPQLPPGVLPQVLPPSAAAPTPTLIE